MFSQLFKSRAVWLVAGVVLGLIAADRWPQAPLHASTAAQTEKFAVATGPLDEEVEGIFFLDYVTGNLKCAVISPLTGTFLSVLETNVLADLSLDASRSNPRFLLCTGNCSFRRVAGGPQWGTVVCYVVEVTSGKCVAYGCPWARQRNNATQPLAAPLKLLDTYQFRDVAVRDQ